MEIFNNNLVSFNYIVEKEQLEHNWKSQTQSATWQELQASFESLAKLYKRYQPFKILVDTRLFQFTLDPSQQAWIDENVNKLAVEAGLRFAAFVVPEDFFASIAVQQTMEEVNAQMLIIKYFPSVDEAEKWLKTK